MRNSNWILPGVKLDKNDEKFNSVDDAPARANILVTRMLTRDLFAVANRLVWSLS